MKRKNVTRIGSILLSVMMVAGLMPMLPGMSTTVYAAEPSVTQFATKDELKSSFDLDGSKPGTAQKVYFGKTASGDAQTWYIAGSETEDGLVLMCDSASPLATGQVFNSSTDVKDYDSTWGCTYISEPSQVNSNHYGSSDLRTKLKGLATDSTHFSTLEQALMRSTTITTEDTKNNTTYTTTDKLYAAYGDFDDDKYITVGTNTATSLNGGLRIELKSGPYTSGGEFWLRSSGNISDSHALRAVPGHFVSSNDVNFGFRVVPAFNLNLSSVIFASAAPAASSGGTLTSSNAMTLRYAAGATLGSATINTEQTSVAVSGAPAGTYLVMQNDVGAWAKAVSGDSTVSASDFTGASLSSFADCKVWLEATDTTNRITTATMALAHTHTPSADWTSDASNHWHKCTANDGERLDIAAHTPGDAATIEHSQVCTICGYVIAEKLPSKNEIVDNSTDITVEYEDGSAFDPTITLSVTSKPQTEMDKFKGEIDKAAPGLVLGGLYDVKLLKDGVTIQPDGKIKLSIPLTEQLKSMTDLDVVYIDDNGKVTIIPSEVKDGKIIFVTDHFSYYGVIGKVKAGGSGNNSDTDVPNNNSPQTGDSSNLILLFTLLLASGGTLTALLARRRRPGRHYSK